MSAAKETVKKLIFPPCWVLVLITLVSFTALIGSFAMDHAKSALDYAVYALSAYSLTLCVASLPRIIRQAKSRVMESRIMKSKIVRNFLDDLAFRGQINIYQGLAFNTFYVIFRLFMGIRYASIWFVSIAIYYLVLGGMRLYLIRCYHRRTALPEMRCYRRIAWLLFLLNIPMGGMILQMICLNAGYSYPGYVIYASAAYTFYAITISVVNLVKFRKVGSPILSAAKVLNLVSAMMSVLGLQTAMIAQFGSGQEIFRRTMNILAGTAVYGGVIVVAVTMLVKSRRKGTQDGSVTE